MKRLILALLLAALAAPPILAAPVAKAKKSRVKRSANPVAKAERHDRNVDRAALESQRIAIRNINALLRRYKGTKREPLLLARLAEIYQQNAAIAFRLAHGNAVGKKKPRGVKRYHATLRKSIAAVNKLIKRYPKFDQLELAFFMRGRAYEEIGQKKKARRDYLHLVKRYPRAPEAISAYMSLAQFEIDANRHKSAITYLKQIEKKPRAQQYPFALFKMGWAYYNLGHHNTALSYLEKHVRYYDNKKKSNKGLSPSDDAIRENTLMDMSLFHFSQVERRIKKFDPKPTLTFFRSMTRGPKLGRMVTRFAKLLRSHDHSKQLIKWKDLLIKEERRRPETMDVLITTFEYQVNKRQYDNIILTSNDLVTVYRANRGKMSALESYQQAQSLLLETAKGLRKLILKNKKSSKVKYLSKKLAGLYNAFIQFVRSNDERIPGIHYNLAETLFEIKEYARATQHYSWVVSHWNKKNKKLNKRKVTLKAIASRYHELRLAKLIPDTLQAKGLNKSSKEKPLDPRLAQWIDWLDNYARVYSENVNDSFNNFVFEGNRALYAQGRVRTSLKRMIRFVKSNSKSKYAEPSASLVLDTFVATKDWTRTHKLATQFGNVAQWKKKKSFKKKLFSLAADAYYKQIETTKMQGDSEETFEKIDQFISKYGKSKRLEDTLLLAGNTALKKRDRKLARKYFDELIEKFPKSPNTVPALLARAALSAEVYDFDATTLDYKTYLRLTRKNKDADRINFQKKILFFHWISGNTGELAADIKNPQICSKALRILCDQYSALLMLELEKRGVAQLAMKKAMNGIVENRPIWATVALEHQSELKFPDRMLLIRIVTGRWNDIDPLVQMTIMPRLVDSVTASFRANRRAIKNHARVSVKQSAINRRIKLMQEMETTATRIVRLPWSRVRAEVLNEIANLYIDFAKELSVLGVPQGVSEEEKRAYQASIQRTVMPFEDKAAEIRGKAFEIASNNASHPSVYRLVQGDFFKGSPSMASRLRGDVQYVLKDGFGTKWMDHLDPSEQWEDALDFSGSIDDEISSNRKKLIKVLWAQAINRGRWSQAVYFIQEAKRRKALRPSSLGLARAVTLNAAGARGEALTELTSTRKLFPPNIRKKATLLLISHYLSALSRRSTRPLIEDLQRLSGKKPMVKFLDDDDHAFIVVYGADWSGAKISSPNRRDLLNEAKGASESQYRDWARTQLNKPKPPPKKKLASR